MSKKGQPLSPERTAIGDRSRSEFGDRRCWKSLYEHEVERVLGWLAEKAQASA